MAELDTVITLDELYVESLIYPHEDLPDGMKMFAQLIIEDHIWLQALLVEPEPNGNSWKLRIDYKMCNTAFEPLLNTVNSDGPSLKLCASFTVSLSPAYDIPIHHEAFQQGWTGHDHNITSIESSTLRPDLKQAYNNAMQEHSTIDSLEMQLLHERILLCSQESQDRAQLLNILGDIGIKKYKSVGFIHDLSQTISAYADAVRDNSTNPNNLESHVFLADLGTALLIRVERLGRLEDIIKAVTMLQQSVDLIPDGHPHKPACLNNLGLALCHWFKQCGDIAALNRSVTCHQAAVDLTPDGHIDKPSWLNNLGTALRDHFGQCGDLADLNRSVTCHQAAVDLTPDGHRDKPSRLNNFGLALSDRFKQWGELADLNRSITCHQAAADMTPDGHTDRPAQLNNLGSHLRDRFEYLGDLGDLNSSITCHQAAVDLTPDGHIGKRSQLNNLGVALSDRFEQCGDLADLNCSIAYHQAAVDLTPDGHIDRSSQLNNLGTALSARFEQCGDLADLNRSVTCHQAAVDLTPDGHTHKPSRLHNLGNCLSKRFEQCGDLTDLNCSITYHQAAVDLTPDGHRDKFSQLNNLGAALGDRFKQCGDLADLNRSVTCHQAAVDLTPDGHTTKPSQLNNLGNRLSDRFQQLGDLTDLNCLITYHQAAVDLTPDGHTSKPSRLNNLGTALRNRFGQCGDLVDLNRSITCYQAAVDMTPDGHTDKPLWLNNLGVAVSDRFEQCGDLTDLNSSITYHQAAVDLTPDGHIGKLLQLDNLGGTLRYRFKQCGDLADLNRSITCHQAAVDMTPDGHTSKPSWLNNLGVALSDRFEQCGDLADLNCSIAYHQAAVDLTPDGHIDKSSQLNNLGVTLRAHFEQCGDLADLDRSIAYHQAAVHLTADDHPAKALQLNNLGRAFFSRYNLLNSAEDCQNLLHSYTLAACSPSGPASVRFQAARIWAEVAHKQHLSSVLKAYATAISLLPELAWLALSIADRHQRLLHAGTVVRDAAAAAIAAGDFQKAVVWLEQGRSIIWGQYLGLRTPVDVLNQSHPKLAKLLISLSKMLETAGTKTGLIIGSSAGSQAATAVQKNFHAIVLQRRKLLDQIRQQPGFEQFLLPRPIAQLSHAAQSGPVVILNMSQYDCNGLILLPELEGEVIHLRLDNFTLQESQVLVKCLASIVGTMGRAERLLGSPEGNLTPSELFSYILSRLWIKIVQPILGVMAINSPTHNPGRLWWCPTGPLAFLPIHAAGLYGKDQAFGSKLSDYVISSYTPSLAALIEGHRLRSAPQTELQLLAVSQPSANGQTHIPGTQEEVKYIQQEAHGKLHVLHLDEWTATPENVQEGMKVFRWVHFACHGLQHPTPTESALLLAGSSRLTLSDIIQLELPNADLAFLSACETATGSNELQDEAVHLTAGMLLAGYRSVIGTMWTIQDNDAPQVARDVYAYLLQTSPDPRQSAKALHLAVQNLQNQGKPFLHWVPFVHFGV
ncbi:CHAT domain-containing protein [Favolaschia claudopus]|uniref:CHAT domain-containing protein n=1 Tax=Favolaschia claudopus TaxID=2862362 RepID=A0AAW0A442_9AGAR